MIKNTWKKIAQKYAVPEKTSENILKKIIDAYSHKSRHYHDVAHIEDLLAQAQKFENQLYDIDTIHLAILFHDIVYDASKNDNEKQSAIFAQKMLEEMGVEDAKIRQVYDYILATKKHEPAPDDSDLQFLLDIDLSILASEPARYQLYTQQIRKEYSIYPDFLYKKGRKKAMQSFLERERIFYFYDEEYEKRARKNIEDEIVSL
jgi:predicted metal-dependent HD superfamily phosphohydrolase